MKLSIIIPVLNEAFVIREHLQLLKERLDAELLNNSSKDYGYELIIVDGGSHDETLAAAEAFADHLLTCPQAGRAQQMNLGASKASGDLLLFLHIDTVLPDSFFLYISRLLQLPDTKQWGFFRVKLSGDNPWFRIIERFMNWRSKLTSIATGDQCLLVGRHLFEKLEGFANIPLMEDVDICRRLRQYSKPMIISPHVVTSSRRWEEKGVWRTILLMWQLRLRYFLGDSPHQLVKRYYP